jgi:hypothetical protein
LVIDAVGATDTSRFYVDYREDGHERAAYEPCRRGGREGDVDGLASKEHDGSQAPL